MKIAQVCPNYYSYFGGVETNVIEVSERLVKKGFEVEVLTTDPSGRLKKKNFINGVKIKRFKSWAPFESYYFSPGLRRYIKDNSNNYEIIHAHSYADLPALYAAQSKKKNILIFNPHYHGFGHTYFRNLLHKPYKYIGRRIFEKSDKIICVSNYEKSLVKKNFNINDEKLEVIPNGVNLKEFKYLKKTKRIFKVILYVGRLEKYKGIHYLIQILPKIEDVFILEIVGKGTYKKHLINLINKLKIKERVKFYQDLPKQELYRKYIDADLFILLSKYEAFGISVAEALAAGTPCIVAKTSALREWIDNRNCFGVDYPINLDEVVKLIGKVIGKELSGVKLYDWDDVVRRLCKIYKEISCGRERGLI